MNWYRAQVILPYTTNLPRDVSVNDFNIAQGGDVDLDELTSKWNPAIEDFYNNDGGEVAAIAQFLSAQIKRTANACEIRYYDAQADPGAPPVATHNWQLNALSGSTSDIPSNDAVCASYYSTHTALRTGVLLPLASRRGRIYLGPFNLNAVDVDGVNPIVAPAVITSMVAASNLLAESNNLDSGTDGDASHSAWCVFSRKHTDMSPIGRGWVDNAWDSQRRRTERPTHRTSWSL